MLGKLTKISFLLGAIFCLWNYRAWFSLRNYTVKAESPALEQRLWEVLPSRCLSFWPWMYLDADKLKDYLERDIPAVVTTKAIGTLSGRFETVMKWRHPWIQVQWRGGIWCVSRDGYMWNMSELIKRAESTYSVLLSSDIARAKNAGPIWRLAQLSEEGVAPSGVIKTAVPMQSIVNFMDEFEGCTWFKMVKSITMERRAGLELFTLMLENGTGQRFELLLQREKYANLDLGATIEQILAKLVKEGGNYSIDVTYEGKIFLRILSD